MGGVGKRFERLAPFIRSYYFIKFKDTFFNYYLFINLIRPIIK